MNNNTLAAGALTLSTMAWAGLFFVGKAALATIDPVWFTLLRYGSAAVLLMALLRLAGPVRWNLLRARWPLLARSGVLGYAMFGILVFEGLDHSVPAHGAVIMATMPVTALMLRRLIDRQRLAWWAFAVLALTLTGVVLVSGVALHPAGGVSTLPGDLTALVGTLGFVFYTRGQALAPELNPLEYTAFTAMLAVPVMVLAAFVSTAMGWSDLPHAGELARIAPNMLYTVVVATVFASLAFNQGVRQLGAAQGIVFINLVPVSALVFATLRGATPGLPEIAGALLVVSALLLQATLSRPAKA